MKSKERAEMGFEGAETLISQHVTTWHMAGLGQRHHEGLLGPDAPFWGVFLIFQPGFPCGAHSVLGEALTGFDGLGKIDLDSEGWKGKPREQMPCCHSSINLSSV